MLIFWAWFLYLVYYFYFVFNLAELSLNSNVEDFYVEIKSTNSRLSYDFYCDVSNCNLWKVSAVNYIIKVSKDWYHTYTSHIKLKRNAKKIIDINLEKKIDLNKVKVEKPWNNIEYLREISNYRKKFFKFFDLKELWYFGFEKKEWNKLSLYHILNWESRKLYDFLDSPYVDINIYDILHNNSKILVELWNRKFIFDLKNNSVFSFNLATPINYSKIQWNIVFINTDKWTFLYNINTNNLEYFYTFYDFIDRGDYILGVINKKEKEKKNNFWFQNTYWDIIIKYNKNTKKMHLIKEVDFEINKIFLINNDVYVEDNKWNRYIINNV